MHGFLEPIRKAHYKHHEMPGDMGKIFIPIVLTLTFALMNVAPIFWLFGKWVALSNFASSILCYLSFEWVHYDCHSKNGSWLLQGPRRFHLLHHAVKPEVDANRQQNYGFTSAAFDLAFSTCDGHTQKSAYSFLLWIPFPVVPLVVHNIFNKNIGS
jgi:hypothetical protein